MGDSPRPSEGADASSAREDETPGVSSESPEQTWAQQVSDDARTQEESEEVMEVGYAEVGYAEAAETLLSAAPYRDPTVTDLSDEEASVGAYGGKYVSFGSITLTALQSAIESVATGELRDDAQALGAAHTSELTGVLLPRLIMRRRDQALAAPSQRARTSCASTARNACYWKQC